MLRTNNKAVKEKVKAYIMESFIYDEEEHKTEAAAFDLIARLFIDGNYSRGYQRSQNMQEAFIWWLQGLPYGLGDHYLKPCKDLVANLLEETARERDRYEEQDAERLFSYLIFKEIQPYIIKNL